MVDGDAGEMRMIMMEAISHGVCKCVFFLVCEESTKNKEENKNGNRL